MPTKTKSKATDEAKSKRPADTPFKQQKLPAWRPILTPKAVIIAFTVVGLCFVPIGTIVYIYSTKVVEVSSEDYVKPVSEGGCCLENCDSVRSNERTEKNPCVINLNITKDMEPPIYMYYKLTRFYQNHRMYVKSRDDPQLNGQSNLKPEDLKASCKVGSDNTIGWAAADYEGGQDNNVGNSVSPCGLIAFSLFNDSFRIEEVADGVTRTISQTSSGIAWESDRETKFHNAEDGSSGNNFLGFHREKTVGFDGDSLAGCSVYPHNGTNTSDAVRAQCEKKNREARDNFGEDPGFKSPGWCFKGSGFCIEDEHFIVWMRTAGLPAFRKLYAKIDEKLYAGKTYQVNVWNGFDHSPYVTDGPTEGPLFPVHTFHGEKYIVLSTTEWIGGKNDFLGIAYLVVGIICLLLALAFFIKCRISPREFAPGFTPPANHDSK